MKVTTQRIYDDKQQKGYRVLVDRLWPRGISKDNAKFDSWNKDVAPSTELRKWFHHDPEGRWTEFCKQYLAELAHNIETAQELLAEAKNRKVPLVLLYGAKNAKQNHALVLQDFLEALLESKAVKYGFSSVCYAEEVEDNL